MDLWCYYRPFTTLRDVDNVNAGRAEVKLSDILDGEYEGLSIDESLAASFGITVNIARLDNTVTISLDGDATMEEYKQVRHLLCVSACWL